MHGLKSAILAVFQKLAVCAAHRIFFFPFFILKGMAEAGGQGGCTPTQILVE